MTQAMSMTSSSLLTSALVLRRLLVFPTLAHNNLNTSYQFWNRICQDKKQGRILVADSYYGGMDLADELQKQKSPFVMACTSSRPSFLFGKKAGMQRSLAKHKWDWSTNENGSMIGVSFYDTGRINFLSNVKAHPCSHGNHSNK